MKFASGRHRPEWIRDASLEESPSKSLGFPRGSGTPLSHFRSYLIMSAVQDVLAHRQLQPKLPAGTFMLPEENAEVIDHLAFMSTQVYRRQERNPKASGSKRSVSLQVEEDLDDLTEASGEVWYRKWHGNKSV